MSEERYLTVEQAADRLQVHVQTIRRWLRDGTIKGVMPLSRRMGYRIAESEVARILSGGGSAEQPC
jgi:excisionase family DNA binding protein